MHPACLGTINKCSNNDPAALLSGNKGPTRRTWNWVRTNNIHGLVVGTDWLYCSVFGRQESVNGVNLVQHKSCMLRHPRRLSSAGAAVEGPVSCLLASCELDHLSSYIILQSIWYECSISHLSAPSSLSLAAITWQLPFSARLSHGRHSSHCSVVISKTIPNILSQQWLSPLYVCVKGDKREQLAS